MKRYLVFLGDTYYPSAGMEDFIVDVDTIEEGKTAIKSKVEKEMVHYADNYETVTAYFEYHWALIYDSNERKNVLEEGNVY